MSQNHYNGLDYLEFIAIGIIAVWIIQRTESVAAALLFLVLAYWTRYQEKRRDQDPLKRESIEERNPSRERCPATARRD